MKPGLSTTEFWLTLASLVAATIMLSIDKIDSNLWVVVVTGATGGYALSRGVAKNNTTGTTSGEYTGGDDV